MLLLEGLAIVGAVVFFFFFFLLLGVAAWQASKNLYVCGGGVVYVDCMLVERLREREKKQKHI